MPAAIILKRIPCWPLAGLSTWEHNISTNFMRRPLYLVIMHKLFTINCEQVASGAVAGPAVADECWF